MNKWERAGVILAITALAVLFLRAAHPAEQPTKVPQPTFWTIMNPGKMRPDIIRIQIPPIGGDMMGPGAGELTIGYTDDELMRQATDVMDTRRTDAVLILEIIRLRKQCATANPRSEHE